MANIGPNLTGVTRCPQCGIANPNLRFSSFVLYPRTNSEQVSGWVIYQCSTCYDVVCSKGTFSFTQMNSQAAQYLLSNSQFTAIIIPRGRTIENDLPVKARSYLEQAIASLHAPDGAIMLAQSAVDAMLKVKGYTDGSAYSRIEKAVIDHVLTEGMRDWAHAVRIESNKPRHADVEEPHASRSLAEQTIRFAEALGEYLFALPARIESGKQASNAATQATRPA